MSYELPDGNVQIAFSGGRTSAYMLHEILEANSDLPDRCKIIFNNTGREMPQTLDFVHEVGHRWSVDIDWLEYRNHGSVSFEQVNHNSASRNGEPFEQLIRSRRYCPNVVARYCTAELKVRTATRYLKKVHGWKNWNTALGIRADEAHRAKQPKEGKFITAWFPMVDVPVIKQDINDFWNAQPFNLKLPTVNGTTPLGNCDGCFLKSEATRAALARDFPDRFKWWEDMEDMATRLAKKPGAGARFRSKESYRSLREFSENQGDWIFDTEGVLCQADDGECF